MGRAGDPWGYRFVKRLTDIVVSLLVIVVLFVPCLVIAAIIALQSKGSPFYTQERVGAGRPSLQAAEIPVHGG